MASDNEFDDTVPLPFGIDANTGRPIEGVCEQDVPRMLGLENQQALGIGTQLAEAGSDNYGTGFGYDPDDLSRVGWGLIFAEGTCPTPYLEAMSALIKLREDEAGARYRVFSGKDGYMPGETASEWLTRHGSTLSVVWNPAKKIPYYLALVGSPAEIPFQFQYSLDIGAAVGRIDFKTLNELRTYCESVVAHEKAQTRTQRDLVMFAPSHSFDRATQLFAAKVVKPMMDGADGDEPVTQQCGFALHPFLRGDANKSRLQAILRGAGTGTPSILFTGSHGMAFRHDDPLQAENQGAVVCSDWKGYGAIGPDHWFSAQDVPQDASVHGLIHFFFACYGTGTPDKDNFNRLGTPQQMAPSAMTARLPQVLMSHPQGGALAALGHIDKAWASSFQSKKGVPQTQMFDEVLGRLMSGERVGNATDRMNMQWGALSTELSELQAERATGLAEQKDAELLSLWIARDDVRNYVILGDPAVKLRPLEAEGRSEQVHRTGL